MIIRFPKTFRSNLSTLLWLVGQNHLAENVKRDEVICLDFSRTRDFDGNLLVTLGVLCARWNQQKIAIDVKENDEVMQGLKRVGFSRPSWGDKLTELFLNKFKVGDSEANLKNDTIPFAKFNHNNDNMNAQAEYIRELFQLSWWKGMPSQLPDIFLELFSNAQEHSESEDGVFICGHVGRSGQKQIRVSIADAGIGFSRKIEKEIGKRMSSEKAIAWAMKEGHTTRLNAPGGLGLKQLKEFVNERGGTLSIVSDKGFWKFSKGKENGKELLYSFPGTVVTFSMNV